ncbi:MAG: hypothetical protein JKY48_09895 [Flavobacteriales bacterium]|nr:hypothetical protein [Flavobacteriales bacterium]
MKKIKQNSVISFWKELSFSWMDLHHLLKGERRNIITPALNQKLSAEENYLLQFETKIAFSGDIMMKIPPYEVYQNKEKWDEQLLLHQKKVNEYVQSQFALLGHIHTIADRIILAICSIKSGHEIYVMIDKTVQKYIEQVDWKLLALNVFIWICYFLFRKFKPAIMNGLIRLLKWFVLNKTKIGERVKGISRKVGLTKAT